jgi:hypothetical protein
MAQERCKVCNCLLDEMDKTISKQVGVCFSCDARPSSTRLENQRALWIDAQVRIITQAIDKKKPIVAAREARKLYTFVRAHGAKYKHIDELVNTRLDISLQCLIDSCVKKEFDCARARIWEEGIFTTRLRDLLDDFISVTFPNAI